MATAKEAPVAEPGRKRGWNDYRRKIRAVGRVTLHFRNETPESLAIYTTYLPRMLHKQILDESFASGAQRDFSGKGKTVEAALIFSDASGFTAVSAYYARARVIGAAREEQMSARHHLSPRTSRLLCPFSRAPRQLTETLARRPNGAEEMCRIMNSYLTLMISTISAHGGDVVKFAGDALLVVFPIDRSPGGPAPGAFPDALSATLQATSCAKSLATNLFKWTAYHDEAADKTFTLSLHIGVGIAGGEEVGGTLTALHVGGKIGGDDRWEFVLAGPPMVQVKAQPCVVWRAALHRTHTLALNALTSSSPLHVRLSHAPRLPLDCLGR